MTNEPKQAPSAPEHGVVRPVVEPVLSTPEKAAPSAAPVNGAPETKKKI